MADHVLVHRIAVFAYHGVLPEEARLGQRFFVSLDCELDLVPAGRTDRVEETVSYADLAEIAVEIATRQRFALIEALAEAIAAAILERHPRVERVGVRVDKPSAPVPLTIEGVSVAITRARTAGAGLPGTLS